MDNKEIKSRFERVESTRWVVMAVWDDIRELVVPYRGDMWRLYTTEGSVDWRENRNVFDSTGIVACQHLASSMHSNLTSPAAQWFELQFRSAELKENQGAVNWLQDCADIIFTTLQESNFNLEVNESYLDICSYGTNVITEEEVAPEGEDWEGIIFTAMPIKETYFEDDIRGRMINFYRLAEFTALQMVDEFGEDGIPSKILDKANSATDVDTKYECIFCIYERRDKPVDDGKIRPADQRRFGAKWILRSTAECLGEETGYYSMPGFALRWRKTSGSQWGNSPAMMALPDIKTLNELVEMELDAIEKDIDPMILANERAMFGDLDNKSGAFNIVKDINGFKTFDTGSNYVVDFQKQEQLRYNIRQTFFSDQLILKESPAMTATEVRTRYQMMQQLMAPTLGRLQADFLSPMITRTFNILMRAGRLPKVPEIVQTTQSEMDIEYVGALSQAQKVEQVAVMDEFAAGVMANAELNPSAMDIVDWDMYHRTRGLKLGVPMDILNDKKAVAGVREERQARIEAAQDAEMAKTMGEGMTKMAEGANAMDQTNIPAEAVA